MDWLSVAVLSIGIALILVALIRTVRGRRFLVLLLWLIVAVLLVRWASYRDAWTELILACGLALVLTIGWWIVYGRSLPAPENSIRVWTKDDPF